MKIKNTLLTAITVIGLTAGIAVAQSGNNMPQHHNGNSMMGGNGTMMNSGGNMMGEGMMGGGNGSMMGMQQGMGCNGMMGGMMMNQMTPDQQKQFMNQTTDLRKKMMETRFAYMEAARNSNTSPQDLATIEKEMLNLRTQMMEKMNGMTTK